MTTEIRRPCLTLMAVAVLARRRQRRCGRYGSNRPVVYAEYQSQPRPSTTPADILLHSIVNRIPTAQGQFVLLFLLPTLLVVGFLFLETLDDAR